MFGALSIPPEIKRDVFEGQDHGSGTLSLNIMYLAWENVSVAWKGVRFICISFSKHSNYLWNTVDDRVEFYLKQNGKSCKCSRRDLLLLAGPRGPSNYTTFTIQSLWAGLASTRLPSSCTGASPADLLPPVAALPGLPTPALLLEQMDVF